MANDNGNLTVNLALMSSKFRNGLFFMWGRAKWQYIPGLNVTFSGAVRHSEETFLSVSFSCTPKTSIWEFLSAFRGDKPHQEQFPGRAEASLTLHRVLFLIDNQKQLT